MYIIEMFIKAIFKTKVIYANKSNCSQVWTGMNK